MTSSITMASTTVLAVGPHSINLPPNLTLAVVGLLFTRVSPEPSVALWVSIFHVCDHFWNYLCISFAKKTKHKFSARSRWEKNRNYMYSLWRSLRPCFQRRGLLDAYWWTPLCQQCFNQVYSSRDFVCFPVTTTMKGLMQDQTAFILSGHLLVYLDDVW